MDRSHALKLEKKKTNVLILCGGLGSRISKITKNTPKPLIKILNQPFLYYIIKNLSRYNFYNFYLLTYYKNNQFVKFKNKYCKKIGVKIHIIKENTKLDTGGSVINAIKKIKNKHDFLLINGDTFLNVDYDLLQNKFRNQNLFTMFLIKSSKESNKLNSLSIDEKKKVCLSNSNLMNSGLYFFRKKNLKEFLKIKKGSFEDNILRKKIKSKRVYGLKIDNNFIDIGSYKSLKKINLFIERNFFKKEILFLDRDNTLNYDKGYTYKLRDMRLISKNVRFIEKNFKNYLKIIVTNQSGIGRGYFSEDKFKKFMLKMVKKLKTYDINISQIYFCPHHIDAVDNKYKFNCSYRKPNNKIINECLNYLDVRKGKNILLIGDSLSDKSLAFNSNISYLDQNKIN